MDFIKLMQGRLSVEDAMNLVSAPNCGAVSLFVGTTRDTFENNQVIQLEYEAYEPMAEKTFKQICCEIRKKWNHIENIAIFHRLGIVPVKESSIIIAISSPHRSDALQATQWCIDTIKKEVPIWKKEIYKNNEPSKWKENPDCPWSMKNECNKDINNLNTNVKYCSNTPSRFVQINCSSEELHRRIDTFIQQKREQANVTNVRDLCGVRDNDNDTDTCARVDAVLKRQKNSKSHLRMQRVYNTYGPYNVNKQHSKCDSVHVSQAVEQRLIAVETSLNVIKPVPMDIYQRLKQIEDRILYLESVSPEYAHFWNKDLMQSSNNLDFKENGQSKKRKFTLDDVNQYLFELEDQVGFKDIK